MILDDVVQYLQKGSLEKWKVIMCTQQILQMHSQHFLQ